MTIGVTVCGCIDIMVMYYRIRRSRIGKTEPIILIIPRSMGLGVECITYQESE